MQNLTTGPYGRTRGRGPLRVNRVSGPARALEPDTRMHEVT